MFDIEFYHLPNGDAPVEDFLDSLDLKMRSKALHSLALLEEFGNRLQMPHSKAMGDGLFELRIKFSSDISRIFYFFVVNNKIILTNGFIKKSQKTPPGEIELAKNTRQIMRGGIPMSDFRSHLEKQLENPAFRAEYEAGSVEYEVTRALIAARISANLTQKELSDRTGIRQSNISRIENGTSSPTISTLQTLAAGMGKKLVISFQ